MGLTDMRLLLKRQTIRLMLKLVSVGRASTLGRDLPPMCEPCKTDGSGSDCSAWYSATNFAIDLNLTDGNWHQVAIYCVDFDNWARVQRVDILDSSTGNVLDSRTLSAFQGGRYVVWNLSGHVKIQLTKIEVNAVLSGIFFK